MKFATPLIPGRLIRRYKRFLADVRLDDGREVTAHCANPGSMMGLKEPDLKLWVEPNDDPKRKLNFSWKLVELPGGAWVGIDTTVPNRVVGEALRAGQVAELAAYKGVRAEVKYGKNSRIDFLLTEGGMRDVYVEVKNVHLLRTGTLAEFPDSVTARGAKHLDEMSDMVRTGHRAVMLYLVQRTDCTSLQLARDLDPTYGAAFDRAREAGVEMVCYDTGIGTEGITLRNPLPVDEPV